MVCALGVVAALSGVAAADIKLQIDSEPPEADVWLEGTLVGRTPLVFTPAGECPFSIRVTLEGHTAQDQTLDCTTYKETFYLPRLPNIVTRTTIEIHNSVGFQEGRHILEIGRVAEAALRSIARLLRDNPDLKSVEVRGHADAREKDADALGLARANAVVGYLIKQGVDPKRLSAKSVGARQLLDQGTSDRRRARNRRVTFKIEGPTP